MDTINPDRFAFEAFTLAFRIQRLLESNLIPQEAKEALTEDYARLKEKVDLLTGSHKGGKPSSGSPQSIGDLLRFL